MWLYKSYRDFILEATGASIQKGPGNGTLAEEIKLDSVTAIKPPDGQWPPVIVARKGQFENFPMLEGRHRQVLPQVPGGIRGWLLAGKQEKNHFSQEHLVAWFTPCRVGTDRTMIITINSGTILRLDVSDWPTSQEKMRDDQTKYLRRAAKILEQTPEYFAAIPSIAYAYDLLENIWKNEKLGEEDPQVNLLERHARELRTVFDELSARPRAMLHTEHQMQKLQNVRRIDSKTIQWLSAQPGRNTAERAGSRQRLKAPKRYETINTLENQVLRAFTALTARATKSLLSKSELLKAHHFRAKRIENMLREHNVPEAHYSVRPNFALRFDPRYNKIWRAWLELRRQSSANELDWMWQHRTFMESLGLRAAMILNQMTRAPRNGNIAHYPVIKSGEGMNWQGCYLDNHGIKATYRINRENSGKGGIHLFQTVSPESDLPLGAVTTINFTQNSTNVNATVWWNAPTFSDNRNLSIGVGALPWGGVHGLEDEWNSSLRKWVGWVVS